MHKMRQMTTCNAGPGVQSYLCYILIYAYHILNAFGGGGNTDEMNVPEQCADEADCPVELLSDSKNL
jgi:hypothetical protein